MIVIYFLDCIQVQVDKKNKLDEFAISSISPTSVNYGFADFYFISFEYLWIL